MQTVGSEAGSPHYAIQYRNQPLIASSRLGLKANPNGFGGAGWFKDLRVVRTQRRTQQTSWQPVAGERSNIPDHFNELVITLAPTDARRKGIMQVVARAYNEGVAFRYEFPEDLSTQILEFTEDLTQFRLPSGTQGWFTNRAQAEYEKRPLQNWSAQAELPLTLELPNGVWASIAQAEQVNYPRVRLKTTGPEGELQTQLFGEVVETSPYATSWRVVLGANEPGKLLEQNYLIPNLNPPNALSKPDWIKPGQVMREVTLSTSGAKALVDFAVQQQIAYLHFDAGWYGHEYEVKEDATTVTVDPRRNPKGDLDLPEAIRYARSKGIGVILYVNHRALERQLDTLFPLYQRWGVSGVKFGFVHTGSHRWTTWLHEAVRKAAQYNLIVDIHDEYRPTGFSRTYPNLLTQEGVLGNEGFPDATHNTILPFTRYLAGAGDYTFCFNTDIVRPGKSKTTQAHQLALPVLYFSPLQYVFWYGRPDQYPNTEEFSFWKGLPTVWDETRVLGGRPGEFVTIARRQKDAWYVGCITNIQARSVTIPLSFLPADKSFTAVLYEDDGRGHVKQTRLTVTASTTLKRDLLASGGLALSLKPGN
ncbi:alpha-glucosidase [Fibrisoma limi BUZ 3]|uniref:Alpha-glucosidase n=2 Tax=Fibrisoma limi TaxID=663275 RepID=I2GK64_9BACT|nr:alpha-glucosidase [Fibrisoma limi BUZ 3]